MITIFFRSSSLNGWDYCKAKYFLVYVLGYQEDPNLKAEKGTVTHKALEVAAILHQLFEEGGKDFVSYDDEHIGLVEADRNEFYNWVKLSDKEVAKINKSRKSKKIYVNECNLELGHERMGATFMNKIIEKCYNHYSTKSPNEWNHLDYRDCWNWTWMAMESNNRAYDPRLRKIKAPEIQFNFDIKEDWAKYKFFYNNEWLEGNLALKGTIDLVTEIDKDTLEIIDWKALPVETPIPTTFGWTTMGQIKVGDKIFDKDGQVTTVVGKSKEKFQKCYRITFDDGLSVESSEDHIWHLSNGENKNAYDLIIGDSIPVAKPPQSQVHTKDFLLNGVRADKKEERFITEIKSIPKKTTQCIMVDSKTNTYLCTENYIPTHNTGQCRNWAKNQPKTLDDFYEDTQLMMYYLAARNVFPEYKNIMLTINYVRDGGPFTICFDDSTIEECKKRIRQKFEEIKDSEDIELLDPTFRDFRCRTLCTFYKDKVDGKPLCQRVKERVEELGIDYVSEEMKKPEHVLGRYQSPGE